MIYRQQNPNYQKTYAEAIRINRVSVKETEIGERMVMGRSDVRENGEVIVRVSMGMTQQSKEEIIKKNNKLSRNNLCFTSVRQSVHKNC